MPSAATQSAPAQQPPQSDRILNALAWVEINRNKLLAGLLLLVVAVAVVYFWRHSRAERERQANAALLDLNARPSMGDDAVKPADFLKVAEEHASTTAAGRARLLAAGAFFTEGKFTESLAEFERVLAGTSDETLEAQAAYGVAASLDALNRLDEAAARYQDVISRYANRSVADQARLALARIHEARNQPEAALRLYNEVASGPADSPFAQLAIQDRETLLSKHPELAGANSLPAGN